MTHGVSRLRGPPERPTYGQVACGRNARRKSVTWSRVRSEVTCRECLDQLSKEDRLSNPPFPPPIVIELDAVEDVAASFEVVPATVEVTSAVLVTIDAGGGEATFAEPLDWATLYTQRRERRRIASRANHDPGDEDRS